MEQKLNHPVSLACTAATGILFGGAIGAVTNAFNGAISPAYFKIVMRWQEIENVWRAGIAQGIFEGLIYGIFFSALFTTIVGIYGKDKCPYRETLKYILWVTFTVAVCWIVGGTIGIGLAALSPEFIHQAARGAPDDFWGTIRFAWVGGSINGAQFGAFISAILGSVVFRNRWKEKRVAS